jgi:hypothetical protein
VAALRRPTATECIDAFQEPLKAERICPVHTFSRRFKGIGSGPQIARNSVRRWRLVGGEFRLSAAETEVQRNLGSQPNVLSALRDVTLRHGAQLDDQSALRLTVL